MVLILMGFLLLFLKLNFTLFDYSLIYIMTNFIGYVLLRIGIENTDEADELYMKDSLWFYLILNLVLLFCRIFDLSIDNITFTYIETYLLAAALLFVHLYVFIYPLYLFSKCIAYLELKSKCLESKTLQNIVKSCIILAITITLLGNVLAGLQYLWIIVIFMQLTVLLLLKKYAVPFEN
ncbi:hypothetical protein [Marinilactibacillus kalidii]|uniref:hypothetical protein n=1 Tax=Marinilactibacillus kalidii TaxID=2820274 RepID=UPI001ABE520E|nr:hypothetical protein [Marinilactibacillus kalidii]